MSESTINAVVSVLLAIVGVAVLALLLSKSALTGDVLGALGSGFGKMLCTALSPITGGNCGGSGTIPRVTLPRGTSDSTITYGDVVP